MILFSKLGIQFKHISYAFISHFISYTKSHLLDWRYKGKNVLEMEIWKMESEIEILEQLHCSSGDPLQ